MDLLPSFWLLMTRRNYQNSTMQIVTWCAGPRVVLPKVGINEGLGLFETSKRCNFEEYEGAWSRATQKEVQEGAYAGQGYLW